MELHHMAPRCRSQVNVFFCAWDEVTQIIQFKSESLHDFCHIRSLKKDVEEVLLYSLANRYIYWMMLLHHFIQHLPCEWSFDWKRSSGSPPAAANTHPGLVWPIFSGWPVFCAPSKSNLLHLVHTRLSLLSHWQRERWDSYLHCSPPPFFAHFPACPGHFGNLAALALRRALNFSFSWQKSALLLSFWATKWRADMHFGLKKTLHS